VGGADVGGHKPPRRHHPGLAGEARERAAQRLALREIGRTVLWQGAQEIVFAASMGV